LVEWQPRITCGAIEVKPLRGFGKHQLQLGGLGMVMFENPEGVQFE